MKRPKLKKASKRLSCAKRYKIQRKVREHHRKLRKEAKKRGFRKTKKDPGVPNSAPFKEELLREAEQRRLKLEEEKEKQKLARKKEKAKRKQEGGKDQKAKSQKTEKLPVKQSESHKKEAKHFTASFCLEIQKVIDASDVILEVLDARDPRGCRCPQIEETILKSQKKKLLLVLNKVDLVPKEIVTDWIKCLQLEFPTVAFKSATMFEDSMKVVTKKMPPGGITQLMKGSSCYGGDVLLKHLKECCHPQMTDGILKVGVIGLPNVGKSSIINSLRKAEVCNTGIYRCTTKHIQEVKIDNHIRMIDCPPIIAAPSNSVATLALRGHVDIENMENPRGAVNALLKQCSKQKIMMAYNLPDFRNSLEFLTLLAQRRGFVKKGNIPDTDKAARIFLKDLTGSKMNYHCNLPNELNSSSCLSEDDTLQYDNLKTLSAVKCPTKSSSITFQSLNATVGLLEDVSEDSGEHMEQSNEQEEEHIEDGEDGVEMEENEPSVSREGTRKRVSVKNAPEKDKAEMEMAKKTQLQVPIDINFSSSNLGDDDAYDFNTDFN
ncbi:guanine nucleotide-binding protein-like 3 [Polypterus senegalus]|uniref:guanine nucleotide-binding protein-like 3 n=1 Tax=Polypterus senegalus TaxID=55291 RepID=UPI00196666D5|nr:guanine nucleotide-binding protein-like 3 [Polypterus senegalus]